MATKPRIVNNLPQFTQGAQQDAASGITQALVLGASEASVLTPVDTSNLLNSQYRSVTQEGGRIVGRVGYTADYALPVHDPRHPQNFRRASAVKEFLAKGFANASDGIDAVLKGALRK